MEPRSLASIQLSALSVRALAALSTSTPLFVDSQGYMYLNGNGCEQDNAKAFHYFKLAAEQDIVNAIYQVGIVIATLFSPLLRC